MPWMLLILVLLVCVWQLRAQGRFWICACGYVLLWSGDIHSSDNSQHLLDPYTFTHVLHGFLFLALVSLFSRRASSELHVVVVLVLEAVWEVVENTNFIIDRYRHETMALGLYRGHNFEFFWRPCRLCRRRCRVATAGLEMDGPGFYCDRSSAGNLGQGWFASQRHHVALSN